MANTFNFGNGNWAQKTEKLLAYNAENNNYKPLPFDFDRASTATRVNKDGLIETVDIDEPRIDFLNNSKGHLLLEPQRQNELPNSNVFSGYSLSNVAIIENNTTSPDGSLNATKIYPTSSGNYRHIKYNAVNPASGLYTFSIFAKADELSHLVLVDYDGAGIGIDFDLSTGIATDNATVAFDSFDMIDYGNGWYRCSATATDAYFYWILSDDGGVSVTASGTNGLYIYGAQIEEGSYATSYIPTSGQSGGVTRSVDYTKIVNSPILQGTNQFTLFFEAKDFLLVNNTSTNFDNIMLVLGAGESAYDSGTGVHIYNRAWYYYNGTAVQGMGNCYNGLADSKFAISYDGTRFKRYAGGVKLGEFTTSASMVNWDTITTAAMSDAQNDDRVFNLSDLRLYNTALTDAELIALTS